MILIDPPDFEDETFLNEHQKPKTHSDLIALIWVEYFARAEPKETSEISSAKNIGSGCGN
ncbi:hypothetical protein [Pseudorhodoferax sp. Leaf267]|uniref:hypothetical protein n=1 Tax=Pseudorhodoferax sp. Leaf267 TaxID=1736316 RepID=UPI00138F4219|nr:hypothetical protein [Pseudorhodoferax sp. Leaf267]